jgi:hypothetical protein
MAANCSVTPMDRHARMAMCSVESQIQQLPDVGSATAR